MKRVLGAFVRWASWSSSERLSHSTVISWSPGTARHDGGIGTVAGSRQSCRVSLPSKPVHKSQSMSVHTHVPWWYSFDEIIAATLLLLPYFARQCESISNSSPSGGS